MRPFWTAGVPPATRPGGTPAVPRGCGSAQHLLDDGAGAGEVDDSGVALAQRRHDLAHVLDTLRAGIGDRRLDRRHRLLLAHLLRQEAFDDRDLRLLLRGEVDA